jgi:hypothetical protein
MIDAGFVWHEIDSVTLSSMSYDQQAEYLHQGDILVCSSHMEIYHSYENSIIYRYTWGEVCIKEPADRNATIANAYGSYQGFWRYEV